MLDVKSEHEAGILAIEGHFENTTHLVSRYRDYLPTRSKKALQKSLVFIFATFGSIVAADAGILSRAIIIASLPTAVAYFLRKLGQDRG